MCAFQTFKPDYLKDQQQQQQQQKTILANTHKHTHTWLQTGTIIKGTILNCIGPEQIKLQKNQTTEV
jgi:hypothetical protein